MTERVLDARLALPAAIAWGVLAILLGIPDALAPAAAASWGLAIVCAAIALRRRDRSRVAAGLCVAAVLCGVVLASATARSPGRAPDALEEAMHDRRAITVTVDLDATVHGTGWQNVRATVREVAGTRGDATLTGLSVPVLLLGVELARAGIGSRAEVTGRPLAVEPGDDLAYLLALEGEQRLVRGPPWTLAWAHELRTRFSTAATGLAGDGGRLLPGLALGDTSAVPEGLDDAMKRTSLSHLTAVSGANCAVVVVLIMGLGTLAGRSRRTRVTASLAALGLFVVLVTPEPSVQRAAVMAAVVLLAIASGRATRGLPVLALAVVVLLALDPWLARQYGFTLSVLATAGLLVLAGPLARQAARILPYPLAITLAVPLAAQLACQPVLVLLSPTIPIYGVLANLLAAPAAPVATVVGLAACIGLIVVPPLGTALAALAWVPSAWIAGVARFCAELPGASAPWVPDAAGAVLATGVVVLAAWAAMRGRRWPLVALGAGLFVWCAVLAGLHDARVGSMPHEWQFAACPVGQGDAMLVRSEGEVALIDTGADPALLSDCLDRLGVDRVSLLVLTHFDLDHVGGVDAVAGRVDRALVGPSDREHDRALSARIAAGGARVHEALRGDAGSLGGLEWRVLWPPRAGHTPPGNAASVVVQFTPRADCARCASSVFLGDLGEAQQDAVLAGRPGRVDVVKVAHHGSADQSARLYAALAARVGLIGVGDNRYGHPTQRALRLLDDAGTRAARTDLHGLVLVVPGPDGLLVWMEHPGDGGRE